MVIGDDQAENFLQDNLPPFCLYTGAEVDGYPFQRPAARTNLWDAAPETKFSFQCPKEFSKDLRNHLIRDGFDMASSSALKGWTGAWPTPSSTRWCFWTLKADSAAAPVRQLLRRRGWTRLPTAAHA